MGPDDDGDDDLAGFGAPLPPDDRLWRHPSELRDFGTPTARPLVAAPAARTSPNPRTLALTSALVGGAVTAGLIVLVGLVSPRVVDHEVVERVALEPVVSSPMVAGDRGVAVLAEELAPSLVRIDALVAGEEVRGSGVLVRDDGLVLTSAGVVADAESLTVSLSNGRELAGTVLGTDPLTDLAVVDLDGTGYPVAVLGSAKGLSVGDTALAFGSPLADAGDPRVASGVISAVRSTAVTTDTTLHGLLQTDAAVWGSCAGGPLVDATGAVVGITSRTAGGAERGITYATPIDVARWVADQVERHGRVPRGWLGVEGTSLSADDAARHGVTRGALVQGVVDGSPADDLGLDADDVITKVDDRDVTSMDGLVMELRDHEPGEEVTVEYWRDGERQTDTVRLDERPAPGS